MTFAIPVMLGVLSACAVGLSDCVTGFVSRWYCAERILLFTQLLALPIVAGWACWQLGGRFPSPTFVGLAAGVAAALALWSFYRSLAYGLVTIPVTLSTLGGVIPWVSDIWQGEPLHGHQGAGAVLILVGCVLVAGQGHRHPFGRAAVMPSCVWGVAAGLSTGVWAMLMDRAVEASSDVVAAVTMQAGSTVCVCVAGVLWWLRGRWKSQASRPVSLPDVPARQRREVLSAAVALGGEGGLARAAVARSRASSPAIVRPSAIAPPQLPMIVYDETPEARGAPRLGRAVVALIFVCIAACDAVADFAFAAGVSAGSVAVVTTLYSQHPVVTAVLAALFLKEKLSWQQVGGLLAAVCGTVLCS